MPTALPRANVIGQSEFRLSLSDDLVAIKLRWRRDTTQPHEKKPQGYCEQTNKQTSKHKQSIIAATMVFGFSFFGSGDKKKGDDSVANKSPAASKRKKAKQGPPTAALPSKQQPQTAPARPAPPTEEEINRQLVKAQQKREKDAASRNDSYVVNQRVRYYFKGTETWYDAVIAGVHLDDGPDRPYYTIAYWRHDVEGEEAVVARRVEKQTTPDRLERVPFDAKETLRILTENENKKKKAPAH